MQLLRTFSSLHVKGDRLVGSNSGCVRHTCSAGVFLNNKLDCKDVTWEVLKLCGEKKEEIWLSPITKAPTPAEMSKGQSDNTNYATKKFVYTERPIMRTKFDVYISRNFCGPPSARKVGFYLFFYYIGGVEGGSNFKLKFWIVKRDTNKSGLAGIEVGLIFGPNSV